MGTAEDGGKVKMKTKALILGFIFVAASVAPALGHPGGLDSKGGHTNKKTGEYHYHRKQPDPPPAATAPSALVATTPSSSLVPPTTFDGLRTRLGECRGLQDSLARLSCFETLTDSLPRPKEAK